MATYRYSKYGIDDSPEDSSSGYDEQSEYVTETSESNRHWLFRDPLRGLSIDKFPYQRADGELKLDFVFKGMMYGPMIGLAAIFESPFLFLFLGLWAGVNYLRRNS